MTLTPLQAARRAWSTESGSLNPCSKVLRAALKAAGLEQHVEQVTTGRCYSRVWIYLADIEQDPSLPRRIADALSPLWADGDSRVQFTSYHVAVDVRGYYHPEAIAQGEGRAVERRSYRMDHEAAERLTMVVYGAGLLAFALGGVLPLRERALDHLRSLGLVDADGVLTFEGTTYQPLEG